MNYKEQVYKTAKWAKMLFGFRSRKSKELARQIVKLSKDLATFKNVPIHRIFSKRRQDERQY